MHCDYKINIKDMTQQEFYTRTKVNVSDAEFEAINEVYNNSDVDKDEFCRIWKQMNKSRVEKAKKEDKVTTYRNILKDIYRWMTEAIESEKQNGTCVCLTVWDVPSRMRSQLIKTGACTEDDFYLDLEEAVTGIKDYIDTIQYYNI